jgi:Tfp pilus assembly protein PilF
MRHGAQSSLAILVVLSGIPFALSMGACGGEEAKPPVAPAAASASAPPKPVATAVAPPASTVHSDLTGSAKSSFERGYQAYNNGDLAGAKQAFTDASHADTRSPTPLYSIGMVLEHQGDLAGAQQQYKAAIAAKPDDPVAIGAYGLSLATSGHTNEADAFLTAQQQKAPNSAPITTFLAQVKSIEGDSGTAQQLAQDALRMNPDYKPAMVAIAHDHYRAHRVELAKYALQAVLDGFGEQSPPRDKDNADAHLLRGIIEEDGKMRAAAMADFDAARTKRPDLVDALMHLGTMKLQAGNVSEATPLLESAIKFAPNMALAHLSLGDAYRQGGRAADARKEFDKALAMDSSLSMAHYDMGLLYLFSPNIPGTTGLDQIATAIHELDTFRTMRGPKSGGDDVDELLTRAQAKQADLKATPPAGATPAPAAPAPSAAAPAPSGSTAGSTAKPAAASSAPKPAAGH